MINPESFNVEVPFTLDMRKTSHGRHDIKHHLKWVNLWYLVSQRKSNSVF